MKKIIVCLLICSGCIFNFNRNEQQIKDELMIDLPYTISLANEINNIKSIGLSEIGTSIAYIPLETTDRSLLKDLRRIVVTDSYIVVRDNVNVLMFDTSGNFLRQIGRRGHGPGEYTNIMDYCFSLNNKKIYLLTVNQGCLEFSVDGTFLNSYKLDSVPDRMLPFRDEFFVFHCLNTPNNSIEQSLIISDLNNNIQKVYKNHHKRYNRPGFIPVGVIPFYFHQGNIRFKEFGVDTLYTITEEELIPNTIINLGQKEMPADLHLPFTMDFEKIIKDNYPGKFWVKWVLEDVVNFYITLNDHFDDLYGYYNKYSNSVKIIGIEGFQNDIDGGLPFFPKYIYKDNILVDYVNAFTLREHVLNSNANEMKRLYGQKYDDLVKLVNSIDDESNPIVVMVKK